MKNEMKKFEILSENKKNWNDITLYQIKATTNFITNSGIEVNAGQLGGWVEKEESLSQEGKAWVFENAKIYGEAKISDNAEIWGEAKICGNAKIFDNAEICGNAKIASNAKIFGNAKVYDNVEIYGYTKFMITRNLDNAIVCETHLSARSAQDNVEIYGIPKFMTTQKLMITQ